MLKRNLPKHSKIKQLKKFGYEPIIIKYTENMTEQESLNIEIDMIKTIGRKYKKTGPLTNIADGGKGTTGYKHSKEYIEKMKEINKGENHPMWGKCRSKETRKKLSISHKGKHLSEDTKKKLRERMVGEKNHNYGKKLSDNTRLKISMSRSGIGHINDTKIKISLSCRGEKHYLYGRHHTEETKIKLSRSLKGRIGHGKDNKAKPITIDNILYHSIGNASINTNISRSTIRNRLKSKCFSNYQYVSAIHNNTSLNN